MVRNSSALEAECDPPQDWVTASRRADHERRAAVVPAWKSVYGLLGASSLVVVVVVPDGVFVAFILLLSMLLLYVVVLGSSFFHSNEALCV